jgi:hypothetical protein
LVWYGFLEKLLPELGVTLEQIAFTNLAKCFTNDPDTEPFLKACLFKDDAPHPYFSALETLLDGLAPLSVFIAQSSKLTRPIFKRLEIKGRRHVWAFENSYRRQLWSDEIRGWIKWREWRPKAIDDYKRRARLPVGSQQDGQD